MENIKQELQQKFAQIIWDAEISNLCLSEYFDLYPEIELEWIKLEKECERHGLFVFEVAHK